MKILHTLKKALARFQLPRQSSNLELIQRVNLKFLCLHLHNLKKRRKLLVERYKNSQKVGFEISKQTKGDLISNLDIYMRHSYNQFEMIGAIYENNQEIRETEIRIKTSVTNLRGKE